MQQLFAVQVIQRIQQAHHEPQQIILANAEPVGGVFCCQFAQCLPIDVFGDVVGGVMRLEVGIDFGYVGVIQGGEDAGFAQEVGAGPGVALRVCFRGVEAYIQCVAPAVAERVREAFFNDHRAIQPVLLCQIGDAEPTCTQHSYETVAVEHRIRGQLSWGDFALVSGGVCGSLILDAGENVVGKGVVRRGRHRTDGGRFHGLTCCHDSTRLR